MADQWYLEYEVSQVIRGLSRGRLVAEQGYLDEGAWTVSLHG